MGLPAIQVFMIFARQLSKPLADRIMNWGKDHPAFRKTILIPIGRRLANWSTRVRMKNLGLGAPTSVAPVSDAIALEQAADFLQQVIIFAYGVGVASIYYAYTKHTAKESVSIEQFDEIQLQVKILNDKIDQISQQTRIKLKPYIPPSPPSPQPQKIDAQESLSRSVSFDGLFMVANNIFKTIKNQSPIEQLEEIEDQNTAPNIKKQYGSKEQ